MMPGLFTPKTFHPEDILPRRHFTLKTFHPRTFHLIHFTPVTFHRENTSNHVRFTPWRFHPTDITSHFLNSEFNESRVIKKEQLLDRLPLPGVEQATLNKTVTLWRPLTRSFFNSRINSQKWINCCVRG